MEFKIGDKVKVIKTEFTEEEWKRIGEVDIPFVIGEVLTIDGIHFHPSRPLAFKGYANYYPQEGFVIYNKITKNSTKHLIPLINKINKRYEQNKLGILT
jgi:hypothetical protein